MNRSIFLGATLLASTLALVACGGSVSERTQAQNRAEEKAYNRSPYVQKHDIEFNNYNKRQKMSDDPTTIVWCTFFPPTPSVQPITVPIVGKLTSGGKRVFRNVDDYGNENVGPDGMYGSSGEYRYGFTPGDNMVDITNLPSFCTTEPTVWQRAKTEIVVATDPGLSAASSKAQNALKAGQGMDAAYSALTGSQPAAPAAPAQ